MTGSSEQEPLDGPSTTAGRIPRRRFLKVAGGAVGAAAVGVGAFEIVRGSGDRRATLPSMGVRAAGEIEHFHSRPDFRLATTSVPQPHSFDGDYLFIGPLLAGAQPGPLMLDHQAQPVWFKPLTSGSASSDRKATNFRPFTYRGDPVLAWWEGDLVGGWGRGEAIIVDSSYREVARVRAAGGRHMDLHEFQLTPQGTALFTCYPETVRADLRSLGGPRDGKVLNSIFQEIDVRTGRLLLEWRSLDHIPVSESFVDGGNYCHINSIAVTPDGNLLVSGRITRALYKLDRRTGRVIWRLGGKRSDFTIGPGAQFREQHDARQPTEGTISLFDNEPEPVGQVLEYSRGLVLRVDEPGRKVGLARAFHHPTPLLSITMGSVQIQPNGNVVVGWGPEGYFSEFSPTGKLHSDAHQIGGSYRVFRLPWRGTPQTPPDLAVARSPKTGTPVVYASWNGDTEAAYWRVHVGHGRSGMHQVGIARRRGFETAIPVAGGSGLFAVTALDRNGRPLSRSRPVRL